MIYALSFDTTLESRRYINYRNLSVEQLGSIYERLLECELVQKEGGIDVRLNVFARKGSGSLLHAGRAREPDYQGDHRPARRGGAVPSRYWT